MNDMNELIDKVSKKKMKKKKTWECLFDSFSFNFIIFSSQKKKKKKKKGKHFIFKFNPILKEKIRTEEKVRALIKLTH
jgi:hypothetical protein